MEAFLGEVAAFAFDFDMEHWEKCDGRLMNLMHNQPLFALLGTKYGGDGKITFALPKIPKDEHGLTYYIATSHAIYPVRQ